MIDRFTPLPTSGCDAQQAVKRLRLNSLGSLYFFTKVTLKRRKLTDHLHKPICDSLERDQIKDVYELPRDHYKSTICSEALPMWWALPLMDYDIDEFKKLGYSDEWVLWMLRIHRPEIRNLLVSENITNSAKLGSRIRYHFESNDIYRGVFPETLPDTSCIWTNFSLHIKIPENRRSGHGEGTFDFLGVGGALQSRHYDNAIEDDLVGRKAIESPSVMDKTIDYHKVLVGAFEHDESHRENNELVVGNRWSYHDLNSHIREHEEELWHFSTHSALGGCCVKHPADTPIFPEVFTFDKLMAIKHRQGTYMFSCQYLNNPAAPDNAYFKPEWLGYFVVKEDTNGKFIRHEAKDGQVIRDVRLNHCRLSMTVDPAHAVSLGTNRCRHAIIVLALSPEGNYYLLKAWAEACGYEKFIAEIYKTASEFELTKFGLETVAAQKFLAYHLSYLNKLESRNLKIIELKGEVEVDGEITTKKEWRIRNVLEPIFEGGRFFVQHKQQDFIGEYTTFPKGRFVDLMDALAYAPQMITLPMKQTQFMALKKQNQSQLRMVNSPYSVGVN